MYRQAKLLLRTQRERHEPADRVAVFGDGQQRLADLATVGQHQRLGPLIGRRRLAVDRIVECVPRRAVVRQYGVAYETDAYGSVVPASGEAHRLHYPAPPRVR